MLIHDVTVARAMEAEVKESPLEKMLRHLSMESKIIVEVVNSRRRETSEVISRTDMQPDGRLTRTTTVNTSKKVPIVHLPKPAVNTKTPEPIITSPPSTKAASPTMKFMSSQPSTRPVSALDEKITVNVLPTSPSMSRDSLLSPISDNDTGYAGSRATGSAPSTSKVKVTDPLHIVIGPSTEEPQKNVTFEDGHLQMDLFDSGLARKYNSSAKSPPIVWHELCNSTITNEMTAEPFVDPEGTTHVPKAVLLTTEIVIDHDSNESKVHTKSRAARKYDANANINEPAITSETTLSDVPPFWQVPALPSVDARPPSVTKPVDKIKRRRERQEKMRERDRLSELKLLNQADLATEATLADKVQADLDKERERRSQGEEKEEDIEPPPALIEKIKKDMMKIRRKGSVTSDSPPSPASPQPSKPPTPPPAATPPRVPTPPLPPTPSTARVLSPPSAEEITIEDVTKEFESEAESMSPQPFPSKVDKATITNETMHDLQAIYDQENVHKAVLVTTDANSTDQETTHGSPTMSTFEQPGHFEHLPSGLPFEAAQLLQDPPLLPEQAHGDIPQFWKLPPIPVTVPYRGCGIWTYYVSEWHRCATS